jgi:hypothetical protein
MACNGTGTGIITDQDKLPLPAASIAIKGTQNRTIASDKGGLSVNASKRSRACCKYILVINARSKRRWQPSTDYHAK